MCIRDSNYAMALPDDDGNDDAVDTNYNLSKPEAEDDADSDANYAMALPEDGVLVACDLSPDHMAVAESWWDRAGVSDRIVPRVGPAIESLEAMLADGEGGTYDFMYFDADKEAFLEYYELGLRLLRPGGLLTFDNMLKGGRVADLSVTDPSTEATRSLARKLLADERVEYSLNPIGDGLALAMLKP